jgi:hypothetical protein
MTDAEFHRALTANLERHVSRMEALQADLRDDFQRNREREQWARERGLTKIVRVHLESAAQAACQIVGIHELLRDRRAEHARDVAGLIA